MYESAWEGSVDCDRAPVDITQVTRTSIDRTQVTRTSIDRTQVTRTSIDRTQVSSEHPQDYHHIIFFNCRTFLGGLSSLVIVTTSA